MEGLCLHMCMNISIHKVTFIKVSKQNSYILYKCMEMYPFNYL